MDKAQSNTKKFSIIIPAYNEGEAIGNVLEQLKPLYNYVEVIVVDDGSSDHTAKVARRFPVRLVEHSRNRGYGAAIKTGIRHASCDIVATLDADCEHSPKDLVKLAEYMQGDTYDMVVGARPFQHIPLVRKPAKWFLARLANYLVDEHIPDLNSGLRIFRKDIAMKFLHLLPSGFSLSTTITLAMIGDGYAVKFVPIAYNKRVGKSKIRPIKDTAFFLQLVVRVVMYFNPLRVFMPVSAILFMLGAALLGYDLITNGDVGDAAVISLNTALIIFMFGLLADLINKKNVR